VGDFNTLLAPVDRPSKQNKQKLIKLTNVIKQVDVIDFYRTFCPNTKEYTFFS
jgi:exonuclease III